MYRDMLIKMNELTELETLLQARAWNKPLLSFKLYNHGEDPCYGLHLVESGYYDWLGLFRDCTTSVFAKLHFKLCCRFTRRRWCLTGWRSWSTPWSSTTCWPPPSSTTTSRWRASASCWRSPRRRRRGLQAEWSRRVSGSGKCSN